VRRGLDVWIALGLLAAGWAIRLALATRLEFPPLDDPAFYVQTARHLAAGRGLVSDVLWSYQFPFPGVSHASHEYWMPMATFLMTPWIKAFGDSLLVAQLPGTLCGALLVPLTYLLGRLVKPDDRRIALGAALMPLAGALPVYQAASTDSAAPFAVLGAGALLIGGLAIERRSGWLGLLAGLLSGLAYLARSDGMLIPLLISAFIVLNLRLSRRSVALLVLLGIGCAVPMGFWWLRNLHVFGVLQPVPPLMVAALQDYAQMFNWNDPPTLASLFSRGIQFVAGLRFQALWHNLGVWLLIAFPYGIFGWLGLLRKQNVMLTLGLAYAIVLMLSSALVFSVPTLAGLFYHSAGAMIPWLAVGAALALSQIARRRRAAAFGLCAATGILIIAQAALAWPRAIDDSAANAVTFADAAAWLTENAEPGEPVIATQAHSLNYASGQPAMSLPAGQDVASVRTLAASYDARYILLTERFGRYPDALDEHLGDGIELVLQTPRLLVYEIVRP
jgi:4-amino-4-deoxy-L-arabinose transferase-like glycosyltransferase